MFRNVYRIAGSITAVFSLVLVAEAQPGSHKHVGSTQHKVGGRQVTMHHHVAHTNHKSHTDLKGSHAIGSVQGKKQVHFNLHANNGKYAVAANGQTNKTRNTRVSTVKGNKNHHHQPHPGTRIGQAGSFSSDLHNVSFDGMEFVSFTDSGDTSLASAQIALVTFNIFYQI